MSQQRKLLFHSVSNIYEMRSLITEETTFIQHAISIWWSKKKFEEEEKVLLMSNNQKFEMKRKNFLYIFGC